MRPAIDIDGGTRYISCFVTCKIHSRRRNVIGIAKTQRNRTFKGILLLLFLPALQIPTSFAERAC